MRPADTARLILTEATLLAIDIDPALRALSEALAGWPSQTPGASPGGGTLHAGALDQQVLDDLDATEFGHLPASRITSVEANAGRADTARRDLEQLTDALKAANTHLRRAADIAHRHATVRVDDTSVKARLTAIDALWCSNCSLHGFNNPRRPGGTVCEYCAQFKSQYPQFRCYPPKGVLEIWTTRGKCGPTDVHRVMRDLKTRAKQVKRQEKHPDWRTKADPERRLPEPDTTPAEQRLKRIGA